MRFETHSSSGSANSPSLALGGLLLSFVTLRRDGYFNFVVLSRISSFANLPPPSAAPCTGEWGDSRGTRRAVGNSCGTTHPYRHFRHHRHHRRRLLRRSAPVPRRRSRHLHPVSHVPGWWDGKTVHDCRCPHRVHIPSSAESGSGSSSTACSEERIATVRGWGEELGRATRRLTYPPRSRPTPSRHRQHLCKRAAGIRALGASASK